MGKNRLWGLALNETIAALLKSPFKKQLESYSKTHSESYLFFFTTSKTVCCNFKLGTGGDFFLWFFRPPFSILYDYIFLLKNSKGIKIKFKSEEETVNLQRFTHYVNNNMEKSGLFNPEGGEKGIKENKSHKQAKKPHTNKPKQIHLKRMELLSYCKSPETISDAHYQIPC